MTMTTASHLWSNKQTQKPNKKKYENWIQHLEYFEFIYCSYYNRNWNILTLVFILDPKKTCSYYELALDFDAFCTVHKYQIEVGE